MTAAAPLAPHSVIGILGGGQLAKMLVQAAAELGFRSAVYSDDWGPALDIAASHLIGPYDNLARLDEFARAVDVVTYEFENVPVIAAEHLARRVPVRPGPQALRVAQDRSTEKAFISDLGIPVAPFAAIRDAGDLAAASKTMADWKVPGILKTSRLGYDGKGQAGVAGPDDLAAAFASLGSVPAVLERRIDFAFEISVLAVRALDGSLACYDAPRNTHEGGILRRSLVPSGVPAVIEAQACNVAGHIATALDYVGVLGVEMFYLGEQSATPLLVNEIAPRVHNSGHWTMDACAVSQFENHIRAITGWPLGSTARHSDAEMRNLIGHDADDWPALAADRDLCLHLYGKREARPGRKMGHVTRLAPRSA
ncbi:5-(carboxyamino)imidazole ribonucleotide synthase [Hyphomicrobium sp. CS1BSMeth3]|uniref:5-(carboxyamino)imidazole ribonucleotide synthase n=1 Tax=Hyphomicrobium sp. CS1BSMeth3 TaxID=1892844 RepID=UPI0009307D8A|nr:5-(carboxyamino)imidazole ribonucleotide synthase [Hyphomicrobium sp. CS1BSMeth3]